MLRTIRLAGAGIGLLLVIAGCLLAIGLYLRLSKWIEQPASFQPYLDRWEKVVAGSTPLLEFQPTTEHAATLRGKANRSSPATGNPILGFPVTGKVNLARPVAAGLLVLILGVLVTLVIGLISAGGRLILLSMPDREMIRKVVREVTGRKA